MEFSSWWVETFLSWLVLDWSLLTQKDCVFTRHLHTMMPRGYLCARTVGLLRRTLFTAQPRHSFESGFSRQLCCQQWKKGEKKHVNLQLFSVNPVFSMNQRWLSPIWSALRFRQFNRKTKNTGLLCEHLLLFLPQNDYHDKIQPVNSSLTVLRAVVWPVQVLLVHLSKIIRSIEVNPATLKWLQKFRFTPLFFFSLLVIVLLRDWKTSRSFMKSCEEGNYPSQKAHRTKNNPPAAEDNRGFCLPDCKATVPKSSS